MIVLKQIKFVAFYGNRKLSFFYSQLRVTFPYLEYCKPSPHSPIVALRSIVLTFCHVRQGLWSDLSHTDFQTKFYAFLLFTTRSTAPTYPLPWFHYLNKGCKVKEHTERRSCLCNFLDTRHFNFENCNSFLFCFIVKSHNYYVGFLGFDTV
jgi:hypothetical protein